MLALLPLLALILLVRRFNLIDGLLLWGAGIALSTELLSLVGLLDPLPVVALWGLALLALAVAEWRAPPREPERILPPMPLALGVAVGAVLATTLLIVLVAPPTDWDSMAYHLPRVAHWAHNGSLAHYPTRIIRQNIYPIFAETLVLHFRLLTGGFTLANLPQWLAMLGCLLIAPRIAAELGAGRTGQAVAVVVLAALPAGIAQATGGKNDYVLALWLAVLTLAILRDEGPVRVGAALGLAALTKPTAYIFALPLMAWAAWRQLRDNPRRLPGYVAICAALLLTLNAGYVARNLANRGSPLGGGSAVATNERLGPGVLASNVARNLAQQAALPDPVGSWVAQAVIRGHDLFGLDATDPAATIAMDRFRLCTDLTDEFCAPNTVHLLLGAAAFALIWAHPVLREARDAQISAAGLVAGFVLFAAALKVDPIRARMHLPLFVLAAPLIGLAAERLLPRRAAFALAWVLLVLSLPWLLVNQDRPLIAVDALTDSPSILRADPVAMHFANNPALQADLTAAADAVEQAGCESVGLGLAHNDWEYPVWLLLGERDYRPAWDAAPLENGRVCAILFAQEGLTALRDEPPGFALRRWGSAAVLLPE